MSATVLGAARLRRRRIADAGPRISGIHLAAGLGVLLGAVAVALKVQQHGHSLPDTVLSGTGGFLFLGAGLVAHARQPANRVGLLMVLVGVGFFAEDLQLSSTAWVRTAGLPLVHASSGFAAHLVLAFPSGRLASRLERVLVRAAYAAVFGLTPIRTLFDAPRLVPAHRPNLLFVMSWPAAVAAIDNTLNVLAAAIAAGMVYVLVRRWMRAGPPLRRVLAPVFATGLVGTAATFGYGIADVAGTARPLDKWVYWVTFCLLPLAFLAGVLRVRLGRTAVGGLLAELREPMSASQLRAALAGALGDPSLQVGYPRPDCADYVDGDGQPLTLPQADPARAVRLVQRDGRRVAALVHDAALCENRHVLDAVTAAAGLALDNQRLAAEVQAQLVEVRDSRSRIVAATAAERRRLERDLHDGVQQRLVVAALSLRRAQQKLDGNAGSLLANCAANLDAAIRELRELAHGIHPSILTEAGLVPALRAFAARAPMAVEVAAAQVPRLSPAAEATAYFVVAEALTNAFKHAHADQVRVVVEHTGRLVRVDVTDDGIGGADISAGSGLLGLRDRVSALDGTLTVRSIRGGGTSVAAAIPCRPADQGPAPRPRR
jgi:signal transduction histidine kinase